MICASIKESSQKKVLKMIEKVPLKYDLIEIWVNEIEDLDVVEIVEASALPLLFKITETSNEDLIREVLDVMPAYIDLDMETDTALIDRVKEYKKSTKLIISHHDFDGTPVAAEVIRIADNIKVLGADAGKIVLTATKVEDSLVSIKVLSEIDFPLISFCMGKYGKISRIFASQFGSIIDFVPPNKSWITAEGQIVFDEWQKLQKL